LWLFPAVDRLAFFLFYVNHVKCNYILEGSSVVSADIFFRTVTHSIVSISSMPNTTLLARAGYVKYSSRQTIISMENTLPE
jgi:hypothetical protein